MNASANIEVKARIVVVDDESSIARFVGRLLELHGFEVDIFVDSRNALEHFRLASERLDSAAPSILITDQTMPDVSGVELVEQVRVLLPGLPVILFTGYSESVSEEHVLSWGNSAYLCKPVDPKTLVSTVNGLLPAAL
ncbi:MAG: response regulator [Gammaproteobacteria bacterium]|nr:response regulator [Gammaproteobacteria bacterium]